MNLKPFLTILTIQTLVIALSAQQAENNNTINNNNNNKLKPLVNQNEVKKAKLTNSVYQVSCNY
jgi:hypothetical protein